MSELKSCPFCGAGTTSIKENGKVWTGRGYSEPSSVSVQHWCEPVEGQPSRMIERVGRDHASAIAAWNRRAEGIGESRREPLTDERIVAIVREASLGAATRRDGTTSTRIARGVEAAHGITPQAGKESGDV